MFISRAELDERQRAAIARLAYSDVLSSEQADAVLNALSAEGDEPSTIRSHVAEVAGYLGGGLMLAGAALFVGTSWDRLSEFARVGLLGGIAAVLLIAAVLVAGGPRAVWAMRGQVSTTRTRISAVLFALAAGTGAFAAGTAVTWPYEALAAGISGLVIAAAAYAITLTLPSLLAAALLGLTAAIGFIEAIGGSPMGLAAALLPLGLVWLALSAFGVVRQRTVGLVIGAFITILGAQQPLGESGSEGWAYLSTALAAVLFVGWYLVAREQVLLLAGVVAVTIVVPEMVWDLTEGAVGGAAVVVIAGVVLLAASGVALSLRSRAPHQAGH